MTFQTQISYAKRRARTSSNALTITTTDDVVREYLNAGVQEFCKICGGIPAEDYLALTPLFDLRSNFAIRLTLTGGTNATAATDFLLATSSWSNLTGASVPSVVDAQVSNVLAISCTLSWDAASWIFSLRDNLGSATHWEIGAPSTKTYVDATDVLFNKGGTQTGTYFEGTFPLDCTVEVALPSDFLEIEFVQWDRADLYPAPFDLFLAPGAQGTPQYYAIKNKRLRLYPVPTSQELLHIRYKSMPVDLATDGSEDLSECPLPAECHWAPVNYATAMILDETHEYELSEKPWALFRQEAVNYKVREANQNPTMFPHRNPYQPIKVIMP